MNIPEQRKLFLVISYDNDEEHPIYDAVYAAVGEQALETIAQLRPHALMVDALDQDELNHVVTGLLACTPEDTDARLQDLAAANGIEEGTG